MKKMHIMFVLDETGSMGSYKQETITGFNEYIETLKKQDKFEYLFSLLKFNSEEIGFVNRKTPLKDAELLTDENYNPRQLTPLYDAIGKCIKEVGNKKRVLFVIQTDGQENASKEYTRENIFQLVTKHKEKGWQFVFLGADQDAWLAGGAIGISVKSSLSYDSHNTKEAFARTAQPSAAYMATACAAEDFFEETDIRDTVESVSSSDNS